jgi:hypothetical protein
VAATAAPQERRTLIRLGAVSAMVGALLALVVNPIHGDLPAEPQVALATVAANANWGLLHLGIMASAVFLLGGLLGLSQVADGPVAQGLARLSVIIAIPGAAVMLAGLAIDGFATKALADLWANTAVADQAAAFRVAVAVETVQNALFHTWAALFIGVPFLLMGLSGLLVGGGFPRWLGTIAVVGGAGALFMGVSGFLQVSVPGVLFNVFAFIVTLWVLAAGVVAWRESGRPVATSATPSAT